MKVALGQINPTIGDFSGNAEKILKFSNAAQEQGADIVVFPELSLCGYPPMDLLDHPAFLENNRRSLENLQKELPPAVAVLLGYVSSSADMKTIQNSTAVVLGGAIVHRQSKTLLPSYDVFDEARYFEPAYTRNIWNYKGKKIGVAICEDIWWEADEKLRYARDPVKDFLDRAVEIVLVPSASPFYSGKLELRTRIIRKICTTGRAVVAYTNMTGANDSLIFDGRSLLCNERGEICAMGKAFQEDLIVHDLVDGGVDVDGGAGAGKGGRDAGTGAGAGQEKYGEIGMALQLGISDYLDKTGFKRVHLGLSGGVDSALVLVLAVQALGPERVKAFMLPSRYSSAGSISDSQKLCKNVGLVPDTICIDPLYDSFEKALRNQFEGTSPGLAEENMQARIRGNLLMAWSNKFNSLLLATGNKSELGVGYCTLYGDMAGALAVIGDLFKTEVYELCRYINRSGEIIPEEILTKAPSAELRPNQNDQDSLPPYEVLDDILKQYFLQGRTEMPNFDPQVVQDIIERVTRAEYKRYQAPPVLKVSSRAFGTGRRIPIARAGYEVSALYEGAFR